MVQSALNALRMAARDIQQPKNRGNGLQIGEILRHEYGIAPQRQVYAFDIIDRAGMYECNDGAHEPHDD